METDKIEKCITFVVPCYNSQDYMRRCVDSLLVGAEDVEIIIVNDGSTDDTGKIVDEYERAFPTIVRAVHKENGGHGSGVNKGLELAGGVYFKVVDSDDWLDEAAYRRLLEVIRSWRTQRKSGKTAVMPDMIVANYVYDHLDEKSFRVMDYRNVFPTEKMCGWNEIHRFLPSQYLIMHALIFKTSLLKEVGVRLPEHTFYVDNLFAYQPLPAVENIYYMDVNLYHYFLGREDQSVNEKVMMSRIDQQIKVTELVADCVDLDEVKMNAPKLAAYMRRNISIMLAISSIHLLMIGSEAACEKRKKLWMKIKAGDKNCIIGCGLPR